MGLLRQLRKRWRWQVKLTKLTQISPGFLFFNWQSLWNDRQLMINHQHFKFSINQFKKNPWPQPFKCTVASTKIGIIRTIMPSIQKTSSEIDAFTREYANLLSHRNDKVQNNNKQSQFRFKWEIKNLVKSVLVFISSLLFNLFSLVCHIFYR